MTVHGAKGLEAPIVILPDTAARKAPKTQDVIDHRGLAVWKPNSKFIPNVLAATINALKLRQLEERDRLLYVALTRAESWLIVMGSGDIKEGYDCWHNAIHAAAVAKDAVSFTTAAGAGLRYEPIPWLAGGLEEVNTTTRDACVVPDWVTPSITAPIWPIAPRTPSELGGDKVVSGGLAQSNPDALRLGTAIHLLLEVLPNTDQSIWSDITARLIDDDICAAALKEATGLITHPDLAHIFTPESLAEVDITAHLPELGGDAIQGSIDRLIISAQKVLAVDFKTNKVVPTAPDHVPEGILRQMGAYASALSQVFPHHEIETAVLWTKSQHLMPLPHHLVISSLQNTSSA
jgi:ATP-dependent helicase/nuclease subunit A